MEASNAVHGIIHESWRPYRDTDYEVSDLGSVRRFRGRNPLGQPLQPRVTRNGYGYVYVGKKITAIAGIVAEVFLGERPPGQQINHKNGIKLDNRVKNLEYVTMGENMRHAYGMGHIAVATCSRVKYLRCPVCGFGKYVHRYGLRRTYCSKRCATTDRHRRRRALHEPDPGRWRR